jgi:hypothetical protein
MLSTLKKRKIDAAYLKIITATKKILSVKRIILAWHTGTGEKTRAELEQVAKLIESLYDEEVQKVLFDRDKVTDPEEKEYLQMRYNDLISQYGVWGEMYKIVSALGSKGMTLPQIKDNIDAWLTIGLTHDYGNTPLATMLGTKPPQDLPLQQKGTGGKTKDERDVAFRKHQKELENIQRIKREKGVTGILLSINPKTPRRKAVDLNTIDSQLQAYTEGVNDIVRFYTDIFKQFEDKRAAALATPDTAEVFKPKYIKTFRGDVVPEMNWDAMSNEQKQFEINQKYNNDYENLVEHMQQELTNEVETLGNLISRTK